MLPSGMFIEIDGMHIAMERAIGNIQAPSEQLSDSHVSQVHNKGIVVMYFCIHISNLFKSGFITRVRRCTSSSDSDELLVLIGHHWNSL